MRCGHVLERGLGTGRFPEIARAARFDVIPLRPCGGAVCGRLEECLGVPLRCGMTVRDVAWWEGRFSGSSCYVPYHLTYFTRDTLERAVRQAGLVPLWAPTHESFSTWFLTCLRSTLGIEPNARPRIAASIGPSWWPLVEHPYRLAMVAAGVATWPLRRLQGALGRGDELIVVARASS